MRLRVVVRRRERFWCAGGACVSDMEESEAVRARAAEAEAQPLHKEPRAEAGASSAAAMEVDVQPVIDFLKEGMSVLRGEQGEEAQKQLFEESLARSKAGVTVSSAPPPPAALLHCRWPGALTRAPLLQGAPTDTATGHADPAIHQSVAALVMSAIMADLEAAGEEEEPGEEVKLTCEYFMGAEAIAMKKRERERCQQGGAGSA